jgi:hypothetical protein
MLIEMTATGRALPVAIGSARLEAVLLERSESEKQSNSHQNPGHNSCD